MKYSIIAHPWAKHTLVEQREGADGIIIYHVYTSAKPIDGDANTAIVSLMAEYLWIKKYQIRLVSGHRSKHKVIEVV